MRLIDVLTTLGAFLLRKGISIAAPRFLLVLAMVGDLILAIMPPLDVVPIVQYTALGFGLVAQLLFLVVTIVQRGK